MPILFSDYIDPVEVKNYTVKYEDWLDDGEVLATTDVTVQPATSTPLIVSAASPTSNQVIITIGPGGEAGQTYDVSIVTTTNIGEVKKDCLAITVQDSC